MVSATHTLTREGIHAADGTLMGMRTRCSCGQASPTLSTGNVGDKLLSWENLHKAYSLDVYGPDPFWRTA